MNFLCAIFAVVNLWSSTYPSGYYFLSSAYGIIFNLGVQIIPLISISPPQKILKKNSLLQLPHIKILENYFRNFGKKNFGKNFFEKKILEKKSFGKKNFGKKKILKKNLLDKKIWEKKFWKENFWKKN